MMRSLSFEYENKKTLLQINECLNLSTGKITQQIGELAIKKGWESWIAYSGREVRVPSKSHIIKIGNFFDAFIHYLGQRLFDKEGLLSKYYTKILIREIKRFTPDIILLHNIHDHWLNYPILFEFFSSLKTPIIWVQHDCWSCTGGCMYFDMLNCSEWKKGCGKCLDKRTFICNRSAQNWSRKKELLSKIDNISFVCVSDWLKCLMRDSFLKERPIVAIHNGIDISVFKPCEGEKNVDTFRILGVAAIWDARKGLNDFIRLRKLLPSNFEMTLVGLSKSQIKELPKGIRGISRTSNVQELVRLYSEANVFVNPTYSDNFPTTNIEALACGTPVITYNTGGSPEAVDKSTGVVVERGDIEALLSAIVRMMENPLSSSDCRRRAEVLFDKNVCFNKYIDLFEDLIMS